MGVSILVLVMKRMIQFIARLNLILRVSYYAMPPYGGSGSYWVNGTTSYLTSVYQLCIYVVLIIQLKSYFLQSSHNMRFDVKGNFEGDFGENLGVIALI